MFYISIHLVEYYGWFHRDSINLGSNYFHFSSKPNLAKGEWRGKFHKKFEFYKNFYKTSTKRTIIRALPSQGAFQYVNSGQEKSPDEFISLHTRQTITFPIITPSSLQLSIGQQSGWIVNKPSDFFLSHKRFTTKNLK